jgi:hypothetical protein
VKYGRSPKLLTISVVWLSRQTNDSFPSPKKLKRAVDREPQSSRRISFLLVDRSTFSSTPGTRRGRPSFPSLDSCLHFHLSVLLLRQERAANSRRLRYRQTVDTCSHSIASPYGLSWTSVDIQRELACWPCYSSRFVTTFPRHLELSVCADDFAQEQITPISGSRLPSRFGVYSQHSHL